MSSDLLQIVSSRASSSDKSEALLLDLDSYPEFSHPDPRIVKHIERFIPAWINLPVIQAILSLSLKDSTATSDIKEHP